LVGFGLGGIAFVFSVFGKIGAQYALNPTSLGQEDREEEKKTISTLPEFVTQESGSAWLALL
jgi:hypothetical protein